MTEEEWQENRRIAHNAQRRERYYYRKSKGLCVACGAKAVRGRSLCQRCADRNKRLRLKRNLSQDLENQTEQ